MGWVLALAMTIEHAAKTAVLLGELEANESEEEEDEETETE
jgi:hypothetical protein